MAWTHRFVACRHSSHVWLSCYTPRQVNRKLLSVIEGPKLKQTNKTFSQIYLLFSQFFLGSWILGSRRNLDSESPWSFNLNVFFSKAWVCFAGDFKTNFKMINVSKLGPVYSLHFLHHFLLQIRGRGVWLTFYFPYNSKQNKTETLKSTEAWAFGKYIVRRKIGPKKKWFEE